MGLAPYTPNELLAKYAAALSTIPKEEFFSNPQYKKLQEMWCAAHFGRGLEMQATPSTIFISERDDQTDADFEFLVKGVRLRMQITEVLNRPGF